MILSMTVALPSFDVLIIMSVMTVTFSGSDFVTLADFDLTIHIHI